MTNLTKPSEPIKGVPEEPSKPVDGIEQRAKEGNKKRRIQMNYGLWDI